MTQAPATLTGQDIAEAQGAVSRLLARSLAGTGTTSHEYVLLRVLAVRGPFGSSRDLHQFLAGQRQLGLRPEEISGLLTGLEQRGLATGTALGGGDPAEITAAGTAELRQLSQRVAPNTQELFAGLDPADLATAHRVLKAVTERADQISVPA